jgi:hypothetical protein
MATLGDLPQEIVNTILEETQSRSTHTVVRVCCKRLAALYLSRLQNLYIVKRVDTLSHDLETYCLDDPTYPAWIIRHGFSSYKPCFAFLYKHHLNATVAFILDRTTNFHKTAQFCQEELHAVAHRMTLQQVSALVSVYFLPHFFIPLAKTQSGGARGQIVREVIAPEGPYAKDVLVQDVIKYFARCNSVHLREVLEAPGIKHRNTVKMAVIELAHAGHITTAVDILTDTSLMSQKIIVAGPAFSIDVLKTLLTAAIKYPSRSDQTTLNRDPGLIGLIVKQFNECADFHYNLVEWISSNWCSLTYDELRDILNIDCSGGLMVCLVERCLMDLNSGCLRWIASNPTPRSEWLNPIHYNVAISPFWILIKDKESALSLFNSWQDVQVPPAWIAATAHSPYALVSALHSQFHSPQYVQNTWPLYYNTIVQCVATYCANFGLVSDEWHAVLGGTPDKPPKPILRMDFPCCRNTARLFNRHVEIDPKLIEYTSDTRITTILSAHRSSTRFDRSFDSLAEGMRQIMLAAKPKDVRENSTSWRTAYTDAVTLAIKVADTEALEVAAPLFDHYILATWQANVHISQVYRSVRRYFETYIRRKREMGRELCWLETTFDRIINRNKKFEPDDE